MRNHPQHTAQRMFLMSLLLTMSTLASAEGAVVRTQVPKLVVNILIDQLRTDYMEAFIPLYSEDGFKRLLNEGRIYEQASYPHALPDLASATATIATGTSPSDHGIIGKSWIDRSSLRPIFCCDDINYPGIGTNDASSPKHMRVTTLTDELKIATEGKSIVYAISPFREVAIFSAGHAADGAVWIDDNTGEWVTSAFYNELPPWAATHNKYNNTAAQAKKLTWEPINHLVGNFNYFLSGGVKDPFSHKFKSESPYADFKTSGLINEEVLQMTQACLKSSNIGADDITDYLAINFYAGGYLHQSANATPIEFQDLYVRLDHALAHLIKAVEQKVGIDNAIFVVTSSGQTDEREEDLTTYRIPTGTFDVKRAASMLNIYLSAIYGPGNYIEATNATQFYLNHDFIEKQQINLSELLERSQDLLARFSGVKDVYTSLRLLQGGWTPEISKIRGAYHTEHSGDIILTTAPGWRYVNSETKQQSLTRESYIPFPIIFYGFNIPNEKITVPTTVDYIAPTLAKTLRIRAPNACDLAPLNLK